MAFRSIANHCFLVPDATGAVYATGTTFQSATFEPIYLGCRRFHLRWTDGRLLTVPTNGTGVTLATPPPPPPPGTPKAIQALDPHDITIDVLNDP